MLTLSHPQHQTKKRGTTDRQTAGKRDETRRTNLTPKTLLLCSACWNTRPKTTNPGDATRALSWFEASAGSTRLRTACTEPWSRKQALLPVPCPVSHTPRAIRLPPSTATTKTVHAPLTPYKRSGLLPCQALLLPDFRHGNVTTTALPRFLRSVPSLDFHSSRTKTLHPPRLVLHAERLHITRHPLLSGRAS